MNAKRSVFFSKRFFLPLLTIIFLIGGIALFIWARGSFFGMNNSFSEESREHVSALLTQAPCLAEVCIGMTGRQAVYNKLSQSDLVYGIRDNGGASIGFYVNRNLSMNVTFEQDEQGSYEIVDKFNIQEPGIPLRVILSSLGEPDDLFLMFGCGFGTHIHAKLLYREKGIEVQVQYPVEMGERSIPVVLNEDMPSAWMWYFDPNEYDEWLLGMVDDLNISNGYFDIDPGINAEYLASTIQSWPSIGNSVQPLDLCPRR